MLCVCHEQEPLDQDWGVSLGPSLNSPRLKASLGSCCGILLPNDLALTLILPQAEKHGLPQSIIPRPLRELDLANQRWKADWIKGYDQSACLVNLPSLQKCVRGYQKTKNLVTGDPITVNDLMRVGYFTSVPTCPAGGAYSFLDTVPAAGVA